MTSLCFRQRIKFLIHALELSSTKQRATLYIPVKNNMVLTGWGSLHKNPMFDEYIEKKFPIVTLDSMNYTNVSFIKIDVEGHELEVMRGASKTIALYRPIVLSEVWPQNKPEVQDFMAQWNYKMYSLYDLIQTHGSDNNYIFISQL